MTADQNFLNSRQAVFVMWKRVAGEDLAGRLVSEAKLGRFETVSINSQFLNLGIESLSGDTELGRGSGWTSDLTHRVPQRIFDHFLFALDKICHERDARRQ